MCHHVLHVNYLYERFMKPIAMSNAKVKFSQSMHDDILLVEELTSMERSKIIRAATAYGLDKMKRLLNDNQKENVTSFIAESDKQIRRPSKNMEC